MTMINPVLQADLQFVSNPNSDADAQNQKNAWLRQMEQEQLALLQQFGGAPGGSAQQSHTANAQLSGKAVPGQNEGMKSAGVKDLLPVHPVLNVATSSVYPTGFSQADAALPGKDIVNKSTFDPSIQITGIAAAMATQLAEEVAVPVSQISIANASGGVMMRSGTHGAPAKGEADSTSEAATPGNASAEESDQNATGEWQKRLMHIAQDGNEISVSIRDRTLNSRQSVQIVSQLAGDAAQSGLRVRQATVNGKTIIQATGHNLTKSAAQMATDTLPSIIESKE